jgi:crotonobetainyl-CoA:carnitine CoA-transferase CaiB-like acyl-CoA transferase
VRKSDVVLDNYRVGVRERLGIDYKTLAEVNRASSPCPSPVTAHRPARRRPGIRPLIQARSGMMQPRAARRAGLLPDPRERHRHRDDGRARHLPGPARPGTHRPRPGGAHLLANQSVIFQSGEITHYQGRPPALEGGIDYLGPLALRRLYQCADGWLALSCQEPAQFHSLCIALSHPEWAGRNIAEKALLEAGDGPLATSIAEALAQVPRDEAVERLLAHGVPAAPALRVDELFRDPHAEANRLTTTIEYEPLNVGTIGAVRALSDWEGWEGGYPRSAPRCGEHTVALLAEFGSSEERIADLLAAGLVRQG